MRTMGNGGQCHPCIHLLRCDSLDGTAGGGRGARGHGRVGRGEGGLCCVSRSRASPCRVQKYHWQHGESMGSDNLCCCSRGGADNRHMWFCWLIKHETGAKPGGLRRRGLTWPDEEDASSRKSDSQTADEPTSTQSKTGQPETDRQTDRQADQSRSRSLQVAGAHCRGESSAGQLGQLGR